MRGRVGPAFDAKKKYRLVASPEFSWANIPVCAVWSESDQSYIIVEAATPLIPGEFVDVVRVDFNGDSQTRYFIARQLDELIGVLTIKGFEELLVANNPTNIWLEEI